MEYNKPKISMIVPVYNTSKFLKQCLDSIINQTYKNLEIILVNDGSTDNSLEILEEYSKSDDMVMIINKNNGGLSSARNAGIRIATGEYILNVDSDDWLEITACEKLLEKALETKGDIIIGNIYLEYPQKRMKWLDLQTEGIYKFEEYFDKYIQENGKNSICNKLIKNDLYKKNNIFHPENISYGEDGSTLLRLVSQAKKIVKISNFIYHYRQNNQSMMYSKNKKIYEYKEVVEIIYDYYIRNNVLYVEEKKEILYYKFFYKILFITGYFLTKDEYKSDWKSLKNCLLLLKKNRYYKFLDYKDRILLNIYIKSIFLGNFIMKKYLLRKK